MTTLITRRKLMIAAAAGAGALAVAPKAFAQEAVYGGMEGEHGLFTAINRKEEGASPEEKKHVPIIILPKNYRDGEMIPVKIAVGEIPHPMEEDHWIERIRLLTDTNRTIAEVTFDGRTGIAPEVSVVIKAEDTVTLIAQVFCNLHGIWESRVTMEAI
jgi:superoxide reductase